MLVGSPLLHVMNGKNFVDGRDNALAQVVPAKVLFDVLQSVHISVGDERARDELESGLAIDRLATRESNSSHSHTGG
jgi:hypothetical protein